MVSQGVGLPRETLDAIGVRETGEREKLGFDVGASEDGVFWSSFLRPLLARGLKGVQLVISDAHEGLKGTIASVLTGAIWQRGRVHCMRNVLAHVAKADKAMVGPALRTIFAQRNREAAGQQPAEVAESGSTLAGSGGKYSGLHGLPARALDAELLHQPAGTGQQGGETPGRCRPSKLGIVFSPAKPRCRR